MTDYFAVLQQPRQPWLEAEQLKQRYQERTLAEHPDQSRTKDSSHDFAVVNEAYRVLADPKLRLQHLLQLEGIAPGADQSIPQDLLDLFSSIGDCMQRTNEIAQKAAAAQNALAKSLLAPVLEASRREVQELLRRTGQLYDEALNETRLLDEQWRTAPSKTAALCGRFAYLTRWIQQLEERAFQLSPS